MNILLKKLKSSAGASLILSLVLALVAVFVGGSVLAAATVNGGRLASRRDREQAYLSQRSIASFLDKELQQAALGISVKQRGSDDVMVSAVGVSAESRNEITEFFYETIALKYLSVQGISLENVRWEGFRMGDSNLPYYFAALASQTGDGLTLHTPVISVSDPTGDGEPVDCCLIVDVSADALQKEEQYSAYFSFPEDGKLRLKLRASTALDPNEGETKLTWTSPSIIKEGSDN